MLAVVMGTSVYVLGHPVSAKLCPPDTIAAGTRLRKYILGAWAHTKVPFWTRFSMRLPW